MRTWSLGLLLPISRISTASFRSTNHHLIIHQILGILSILQGAKLGYYFAFTAELREIHLGL